MKIPLERRQKEGRVDREQRMLRELKEGTGYEKEVNLTNSYNYQYYGKLWIGSHLQEMTFIFDTGSAWTWIPSEDCSSK